MLNTKTSDHRSKIKNKLEEVFSEIEQLMRQKLLLDEINESEIKFVSCTPTIIETSCFGHCVSSKLYGENNERVESIDHTKFEVSLDFHILVIKIA